MEMRRTEETGGVPAGDSEAHTRTLVGLLLADAVSDVDVVRRELSLSEAMVERLQRAVDRLHCAQAILDAAGRRRFGSSGSEVWEQLGEALQLLAESWPQDYPEGAVELLAPV
jgi:hypothetical protein